MAVSGGKRGRQRRRTGAEERLLIVVAGPNGAGKSTFVETFLKPTGILIVNPDEVAKGLSPDSPEDVAYEAARVADTWRRDLATRGVSFCMETVFSDPQGAKLDFLKECQSSGYTVILVFIGLDSAVLSLGRVIQRVERGGHDVPDEKIEARFPRTFDNLRQAMTFVDEALLFDNSSSDQPFRFVAAFKAGKRQRRKGFAPAWAAMLG
jgi:predicted ABC-type ATPase